MLQIFLKQLPQATIATDNVFNPKLHNYAASGSWWA